MEATNIGPGTSLKFAGPPTPRAVTAAALSDTTAAALVPPASMQR